MQLQPGDILFLYTDGVTEAMNLQDVLYEEQRLLAVATALQRDPLVDIVNGTVASIKAFTGSAPQSDDITIMAIEYLGPRRTA